MVPKVILVVAATAATAAVAETRSPWTPELIVALFAGLTGLIGAVTTLIVSVLRSRAESKLARAEAKVAQKSTEEKIEKVRAYVDGDRTKLLEENARLTARLATLTSSPRDQGAAEHAEGTAANKREVVEEMAAKAAAVEPAAATEPPKAKT